MKKIFNINKRLNLSLFIVNTALIFILSFLVYDKYDYKNLVNVYIDGVVSGFFYSIGYIFFLSYVYFKKVKVLYIDIKHKWQNIISLIYFVIVLILSLFIDYRDILSIIVAMNTLFLENITFIYFNKRRSIIKSAKANSKKRGKLKIRF